MSERQRWEPPYTVTEWIGLALAVLGAMMVGACAYNLYGILTMRF